MFASVAPIEEQEVESKRLLELSERSEEAGDVKKEADAKGSVGEGGDGVACSGGEGGGG